MALIDNLISYWKLDEIAGINVDDAHSTNDLTTFGAPTWVAGKINNGLEFNGSTIAQRADRVSFSELAKALDYSVSFWVNFDTLTNNDAQVLNWVSGNDNLSIMLRDDSGMRIIAAHWDGDQDNHKETSVLSSGTWYHVIVVHTGADNTIEIYLDSVLQDNIGVNSNFLADAKFMLGNFRSAGFEPMDGIIDEVGIWSRKLTSDERTNLYNLGDGLAYPFVVGTNMQVNISDVLKDISEIKINIGGVLKDVTEAKINIGDVLKNIF